MKTYVLSVMLFLTVCSVFPLYSDEAEQWDLGLFVDFSAADTIWEEYVYLHGGIVLRCQSDFALEIPCTYVITDQGKSAFDTGVVLKYYPGGAGLWVGASLFQGISLFGDDRPSDWYLYMQELSSGFTLQLPYGLYIEPTLILRNVNGMFSDSLEVVSEYVEGYSRLRFCLNFGWAGIHVSGS